MLEVISHTKGKKTKVPKVISFVNFKGGVGKTSVAVNVAATLASEVMGKDVLLVDADAQANATIWCLGQKQWRDKHMNKTSNTLYQILQDAQGSTKHFDFEQAVIRDGLLVGNAPHLHLLASTYKMMEGEDLLWGTKAPERLTVLQNALSVDMSAYDVVIFDCPPNTYYVTQNALKISQYIFVVAIPDFLSVIGFSELVERLRYLWSKTRPGIAVPVSGVIANSHNPKYTELRNGIVQLRQLVSELVKKGHIDPNCKVLSPSISRSISCSNAARKGLPVAHTKTPGGIKLGHEFQELTNSIIRTIGMSL